MGDITDPLVLMNDSESRRQVMGHELPHEGKDDGSNNGDWGPHQANEYKGKCKTIK